MSIKGAIGPIVVGLLCYAFSYWVGWWSLLIAVGAVIGYLDPWDLKGNRR